MRKFLTVFLISIMLVVNTSAQSDRMWNGKKCAVVLTYDDGLDIDLDNVVTALDSLGLKATFYIPGNSSALANRLDEWRKAAAEGHELGNHTLFHPCDGNVPGRDWVTEDYDLSRYTLRRAVDEIRVTNVLLRAIDGKSERTFAYPCGDLKVGDDYFMDQLKDDFPAARGVRSGMHKINNIDIYNVDCYMIDGQTGDQMIDLVKKAIASNSLLVFLFHGVGGGHNINVSLTAHSQLLHFLKQNENKIWIPTMLGAAKYIRAHQ